MNSIFLRIYGGMLAAMVLVALLGALAVERLNDARLSQYREELANGTFRLMADNLSLMNPLERNRSLVLWGRLLGLELRIEPLAKQGLESGSLRKVLERRAVVEEIAPHRVRVYSLVDDTVAGETVLLTEIEQVSEQLARASIYLLIDELVRYPEQEQPGHLALLKQAKGFGFDLRLLTLDNANLDIDQRRRVQDGDTVMALSRGGDAIHVFAGVSGTSWVMEMGPLYQMNPYPRKLLAAIVALGLTLIGLIVYLLVRQLERRLKALESTATQITQGDLCVRADARSADSVGRLAATFNNMTSHLQGSLASQKEMVRAVSHELRTPVARMRFALQMIEDATSDQARSKYLTSMDSDIQELDRLLDEMLTYARLEHGSPELTFRAVDLNLMIDQLLVELAPLRPEIKVMRGPYSASSGLGSVFLDAEPRYLQRALQNLISNAMRHAESKVWVSFWVGTTRCRVEVEDDGPGVPEEDRQRIFTPFIRLDDSRTRASGGHGLGLSIVQRIVFWHEGSLEVGTAETLGGARFSVLLPRKH